MDPIITSAITSFVTTIATNSSKAPMQTLDDLWYLAFGKISHIADLKRAKNEVETTLYKDSVARKILDIDDGNLQEPPMSVVGPALEASRYYIEEEELREMFAKVIAASMDKSKSHNVHHAFVEIIKQISPADARNLTTFKETDNQPIVQFKSVHKAGKGYQILKTNVFLGHHPDIITGDENATSMTNLHRLGLVTISYEENYTDKTRYSPFLNSKYFITTSGNSNSDHHQLELGEGIIRLTPFGKSFINVCI